MTARVVRVEAEVAARLAELAAVADDTDPTGTGRPSLEACLGRTAAALDAIVRLRALDAVAALHRLEALGGALSHLALHWLFSIVPSPIWDELDAMRRLFPDFYRALIPGDPADLAERVFRAVAGTRLRQRGLPPELLAALGRDGREDLVLRIARRQAGPECWADARVPASYVTALLLAEPDSDHLVRTVLRHDLEELVVPGEMAERLMAEGRADLQPTFWLGLALDGDDQDEDDESADDSCEALVARCLAHCEAAGLPGLAQEVRWCAFGAFFTAEHLRAWLDGVPPDQRAAEAARAVQYILADEDGPGSEKLQLLIEWPDLTAAAALVRQHHAELTGGSRAELCRAAACLEASAPDAALLLLRAAFLSPGDPQAPSLAQVLDGCAALWARCPGGPYESHAGFVSRVRGMRRPEERPALTVLTTLEGEE